MRSIRTLLVLLFLVAACGSEEAATTSAGDDASPLTSAEREWCTLDDASEETAQRFDQIFEAGRSNRLPMDAMNAQASVLRSQYEGEGMTADQAVTRVFEDLVQEPAFIEACKLAYATYAPAG